ncbi:MULTISPECIES: lipoate--protein ligase family protein [Bifidobacterium]|uniref:lipoate--protein ligase family protein n=1 Tax=Bifidobacterium TaxID=1678 RepID=UPI001BDBFEE9|nr:MULTISPECIES: lipoate--protein ligase family protein [Bifidobacterium]MBT1161555.1 lipoate--protein ligase family protein [Bifidobacterium sp. SO1]MBW3078931.1 lipoate--protein ligase family protein [Bifidobacterium simiiventris]
MGILRGECKTPGGKLVAVRVTVDGRVGDAAGRNVVGCRLDGDFFVDGDDAAARELIDAIERALMNGEAVESVIERYETATGVRLVGTDAAAIDTAFMRATGGSSAMGVEDCSTRLRLARPDSNGEAIARHDNIRGETLAPEIERRWAALRPVVIHDIPRGPAEQMTIDEQWAREVASGERPATIRFWEWASPAVVVGRYQSIPDEVHEDVAARDGFAVVRRCTGGGAMFIEPGNTITYSLYVPLSFVAGIGIEESYRLCDHWLIESLHAIGVRATFSGVNDIAATDPATGAPAGKIGGAAQRRFPAKPAADGHAAGPGSLLHHVTLAYDIDADHMGRILNTSAEKLSDKAVRSARKRVDPLRSQTGMPRDEIVRRMIAYLRTTYCS